MEKYQRYTKLIVFVAVLVGLGVAALFLLSNRLAPGSDKMYFNRFEKLHPDIAMKQFPLEKAITATGEEIYNFPCLAKSVTQENQVITSDLTALMSLKCLYYDAQKNIKTLLIPAVVEEKTGDTTLYYSYYSGGYVRKYSSMSETQMSIIRDELNTSLLEAGQPISMAVTLARFPEEDHPGYSDEIKFLKKFSNQLYSSDQLASFSRSGDPNVLYTNTTSSIVFPTKLFLSKPE